MHGHLSQVPRLLSPQVVQAPLPRQFVSARDPSICYGCVTWCLGSRESLQTHLGVSGTRPALEMTASSESGGGALR